MASLKTSIHYTGTNDSSTTHICLNSRFVSWAFYFVPVIFFISNNVLLIHFRVQLEFLQWSVILSSNISTQMYGHAIIFTWCLYFALYIRSFLRNPPFENTLISSLFPVTKIGQNCWIGLQLMWSAKMFEYLVLILAKNIINGEKSGKKSPNPHKK